MPGWSRSPGSKASPALTRAEAVGIIFPVHMWGLPRRVISFVDALANDPSRYYFAVAVNAGQVAATLLQLKKRMQSKGMSLSTGFGMAMPSNYIPWGGPGPEEKRRAGSTAAREKLGVIAAAVAARKQAPVEKGPSGRTSFLPVSTGLPFPTSLRWTRVSGSTRSATPAASARRSAPAEISICEGQARLAAPLRTVPRLHPVVPAGGDPVRQEDARATSDTIIRR